MITLEKIPASIRATRAALDLNQEEFGKLVGLSRPTIARLEIGILNARMKSIVKLQPVIDRTLSSLISDRRA